jgi:ribosomal-protein-alanine N-acetyltransferase
MTEYSPPPPWFPLVTERLILREYRAEDLCAVHAYAVDPEVTRFMTWGPNTPGMSRQALDRRLAEQRVWPRDEVNLAVVVKAEDRLIGAARFQIRDPVQGLADFGYVLGRAAWGRGFATELAKTLVRVAFDRLDLHRLWATCDALNTASQGVLRKAGLRHEGRFRRDVMVRGAWRDTDQFAILREDWLAGREAI